MNHKDNFKKYGYENIRNFEDIITLANINVNCKIGGRRLKQIMRMLNLPALSSETVAYLLDADIKCTLANYYCTRMLKAAGLIDEKCEITDDGRHVIDRLNDYFTQQNEILVNNEKIKYIINNE